MKPFFLFLFLGVFTLCNAQSLPLYTTGNAHSHNDYQKPFPFKQAYDAGFGSIEADIILDSNKLFIAHERTDLSLGRTLEDFYLLPLSKAVKKNNGFPFSDKQKELQLLIDIKSQAIPTLQALIHLLQKYPALTNTSKIKWVISGNRPPAASWNDYPDYIFFDGDFEKTYTQEELKKTGLFSASLKNYTQWDGKSDIPPADAATLKKLIDKAHATNKKTRFWASPDFENAWYQLMNLGVDYINTDKIMELQNFLNNLPKNPAKNSQP